MVNARILAVNFGRGVFLGEDLPSERIGTVSALHVGKVQVLARSEVAGVCADNIEEAGFGLGVAEFFQRVEIDVFDVHRLRISAVISRSFKTRRKRSES